MESPLQTVCDFRMLAVVWQRTGKFVSPSLAALAFANLGLSGIIQLSIPVLMMLYPLSITLVLIALGQRFFPGTAPTAYKVVTAFTMICAVGDFIRTLPEGLATGLAPVTGLFERILPFYNLGMGWVIPALVGFLISLYYARCRKNTRG